MNQKLEMFTPPFVACPYCGGGRFGICTISGHSYTRRCNDCWRPQGFEDREHYPLPELSKKVIYLDQFVISNIARVFTTDPGGIPENTLGIWTKIGNSILRTVRAQLAVCPSSWTHETESALAKNYEALRRMYHILDGGVSFMSFDSITSRQVYFEAVSWLGLENSAIPITLREVTYGELDVWTERWSIGLKRLFDADDVVSLREGRTELDVRLGGTYDRWRSERHKSFDEWYKQENDSFGPMLWKQYCIHAEKWRRQLTGVDLIDAIDLISDETDILVTSLIALLEKGGSSKEKAFFKVKDFFYSDQCKEVPCTVNESLLWAAVARKCAAGQKRQPGRGMRNDVVAISHLYPYCDAMFIDKECFSLLKENPLPSRMVGSPRLFSLLNLDDLFQYLTELEEAAPNGHLEKVSEVYGESWRDPLNQ